MRKHAVNIADVPLRELSRGESFAAKLGRIGPLIGAKKLGCQLHIVPPGKKAFPRHAHHVNEEMFYIVEGSGTCRIGDDTFPVRAGDVIATPPGDGSTAHQIVNTSDAELRYLVFSTRLDPEVVEYPDSGKIAVSSMVPDEGGLRGARVLHIWRPGSDPDYWDGEE
jgi:uncharacterized cupin superfamily protein